ncbi:40S ribosomal protein S17.e.B [Dimargaris verticillata]|uniref:40S ribosomal protein S17.e.B n=1 Tax=Dimargaris verticillata TaxID=2761393 RepID=A0A9W8AYH0_9FUNG|nr:40S ribosomal protein S17.e.B [Dimargaris verticillata]
MGAVRTKTIKKASRVLIEKYYPRLTLDFQVNKRICDEVAVISSKRLRNKIAGYTTHLMRRIQRGPVRGISFKLQEEERERKDNYVPDVSALQVSSVDVDAHTKGLIKSLGFGDLAMTVASNQPHGAFDRRRKGGMRPTRGGAQGGAKRTGAPRSGPRPPRTAAPAPKA